MGVSLDKSAQARKDRPALDIAPVPTAGSKPMNMKFDIQSAANRTSDEERAAVGARRLPADLSEAADALADSAFARDVLGADLHDAFVATRRSEWETLHELDRSALIDFHELRYG